MFFGFLKNIENSRYKSYLPNASSILKWRTKIKNYKTSEIENIIKILEDYYSIINGRAIKAIFLNSEEC